MDKIEEHKAGFVNIVGKPNVGKSTLINLLIKEKISIITPKAQTTRQRALGIINEENYQIIFSDTPGILTPKYALQEKMLSEVKEAFKDADIYIFIVELTDKDAPNEFILEKLQKTEKPVLLVINKIDLASPEVLNTTVAHWHQLLPNAEILPISSLFGFNTELIIPKLIEWLPYSPPYYDKDSFTNKPQRFFVNETIREKVLLHYDKEVPYAVEVVTENFEENENSIKIECILYVERSSQKGIIIGHKGAALSKVNYESRQDLEKFFEKKITLNIYVKVRKDWRKNERDLKDFGY